MIYLSKGIVQKGSTEQLLFVLYGGQKFELSENAAAAWLNGRFNFAEALGRNEPPIAYLQKLGLVETEADKARNDLLDLVESLKTKRILTGTIQGIERPADHPSRSLAVIYHGEFKILIPANEFMEEPDDTHDQPKETVLNYMMTRRMGAEVDYVIKGIDANARIAAASRLEAMRIKRRQFKGFKQDIRSFFSILASCLVVKRLIQGFM